MLFSLNSIWFSLRYLMITEIFIRTLWRWGGVASAVLKANVSQHHFCRKYTALLHLPPRCFQQGFWLLACHSGLWGQGSHSKDQPVSHVQAHIRVFVSSYELAWWGTELHPYTPSLDTKNISWSPMDFISPRLIFTYDQWTTRCLRAFWIWNLKNTFNSGILKNGQQLQNTTKLYTFYVSLSGDRLNSHYRDYHNYTIFFASSKMYFLFTSLHPSKDKMR